MATRRWAKRSASTVSPSPTQVLTSDLQRVLARARELLGGLALPVLERRRVAHAESLEEYVAVQRERLGEPPSRRRVRRSAARPVDEAAELPDVDVESDVVGQADVAAVGLDQAIGARGVDVVEGGAQVPGPLSGGLVRPEQLDEVVSGFVLCRHRQVGEECEGLPPREFDLGAVTLEHRGTQALEHVHGRTSLELGCDLDHNSKVHSWRQGRRGIRMKKQPGGAGTAPRRNNHRPDSVRPLEITALGMIADPAFDPADPTLPRFAERLVVERTGVRCAWPAPERDWTLERLLREAGRTGTLPHVLAVAGLFKQADTRDAVLREGLAHEVTEELVEQHMPLYAARVRRYGWSVREVLARNRCGGRSICVPMGFGLDEFPGLVGHPGAKVPISFYYALDFRDDILAKIIPGARTEAQLRDLLARKGSLDIHDLVDDMPLRSLEDLRQYFLKVKALGVKAGDAPVVPASPIVSFEHPESMYWSLGTAAGLFWDYPFIVGDPPDWERTQLFWFTRECQRYLRWWNRIWHDGLLGDDPFAMAKAEQREGQRAGRYAVINDWSDPEEARTAALERGYGYRYFPLFLGGWSTIWGNYALPVECREGPLVFTRRIQGREALARVMRWADWHLGEERDVLAYWGLPDWHAGTGADRRFTWQHAALEDWSVYGACSDRDGPHVGLEHTPALEWDPRGASGCRSGRSRSSRRNLPIRKRRTGCTPATVARSCRRTTSGNTATPS